MDSLTSVAMVAGTILAPILVSVAGLEFAFAVGGIALADDRGHRLRLRPARGRAGGRSRGSDPPPRRRCRCSPPRRGSPSRAWPRTAARLQVAAGEDVIHEGDAPDALYVIVVGEAVVTSAGRAVG